jgi:hypothetical protein
MRRHPIRSTGSLILTTIVLAGCGSAVVPAVSTPKATTTPVPSVAPSPSLSVTAPTGPLAVLVSNGPRTGSTYDVILVDASARVIARTGAHLPLLKPNQTIQLPLVSASNDTVYYLDGDTEIHSLSAGGATQLVKTIREGSASIISFAVSADDKRIAVSLINQKADLANNTGRGYVEDLAGGNRRDLFNNTGADAYRWPVGWHGADIVDAVGYGCGYGNGYGSQPITSSPLTCAQSYHLISGQTGQRTATLCEPPATQAAGQNYQEAPQGSPVAGGTACSEYTYYNDQVTPPTAKLFAADWSARETAFITATGKSPQGADLGYTGCFLAVGGSSMACSANGSQALTIIAPRTTPHNLGRRYAVLGWVDSTHIVVGVDSKTIAVLATDSGAVTSLALPDADKLTMNGVLPGAL